MSSGACRRITARAVRVLRLLDATGSVGITVAELAAVIDTTPLTVAGHLDGVIAADEPLEASGPLHDPATRVRWTPDGEAHHGR